MKAIINGMRYDTDTAEEICSYVSDLPRTDIHWYEEKLYRTKKGAWFLHGRSNGRGAYAKTVGNATTAGEGIVVLTHVGARTWLESNKFLDLVERLFADMIEDA